MLTVDNHIANVLKLPFIYVFFYLFFTADPHGLISHLLLTLQRILQVSVRENHLYMRVLLNSQNQPELYYHKPGPTTPTLTPVVQS